jgi:hypothetical protein
MLADNPSQWRYAGHEYAARCEFVGISAPSCISAPDQNDQRVSDPSCLTLASDLHRPAKSRDLNVIDNLWAILKQRMADQDSQTPDQLWQHAETASNEMTAHEVNHLVQSFASPLQVIMALHGESLNGQGDIRRSLMDGYTADQILSLREQETGIIRTFTEQSRVFFADPGWSEVSCPHAVPGPIQIVQQLFETTRSALGMRHEKWTTESGAGE